MLGNVLFWIIGGGWANHTTSGGGVSLRFRNPRKVQRARKRLGGEGGAYLIPSPQNTNELPAIAEGDK